MNIIKVAFKTWVKVTGILSILIIFICIFGVYIIFHNTHYTTDKVNYLVNKNIDKNYKFSLGNYNIISEKDEKKFVFSNIKISEKTSDKLVVNIPEIKLLYLNKNIYRLKLLPSEAYINDITVNLTEIDIHKPLKIASNSSKSSNILESLLIIKLLESPRYFAINNAVIKFHDHDVLVDETKIYTTDEGEIKGISVLDANDTYAEFVFKISSMLFNNKERIVLSAIFDNTPFGKLLSAFDFKPLIIEEDVAASGKIETVFNKKGRAISSDIWINDFKGHISNDNYFSEPLNIKRATIKAEYKKHDLTVNEFIINFADDTKINLSGNCDLKNNKYKINAYVNNLLADNLQKYWPQSDKLAPYVRKWMTENITQGIYQVNGVYDIDLNNKIISKGAIKTKVMLQDAQVIYHPELPRLSNVDAEAIINEDKVNIKVKKGQLKNGYIQDAFINIPYDRNSGIDIIFDVNSSIKGLIDFTGHQNFLSDKILGNAVTHGNIYIPYKNDLEYKDIKINIDTKLGNAKITKLFSLAGKDIIIDNQDGQIKFDGENLSVNSINFIEDSKFHTSFTKNIYKPNAVLKIKGNLKPKFINSATNEVFLKDGKIALVADIDIGENDAAVMLKLNGTDANFYIKELNISKKLGENIELKTDINYSSAKTYFKNISINGNKLNALGEISYDNKQNKIDNIKFKKFNYEKHDFSFERMIKNGVTITNIEGKSFDYKNFLSKDEKKIDSQNITKEAKKIVQKSKNTLHEIINLKIDKTILFKDHYLKDLQVVLDKTGNVINSLNINGIFNGQSVLLARVVTLDEKEKLLSVSTPDLGLILQGFNILPNFRNGILEIEGVSNNSTNFQSKVGIRSFTIFETPFLTNFIKITSLQGIGEMLTKENSLYFDDLHGKIDVSLDKITLDNIKINGASLKGTLSGEIDIENRKLNIVGEIIPPFYGLNSLSTAIPLVREIFGGKNGGIIGAGFKIRGDFDHPDISINPVSVFLPGILRKIIQ